ncbi:uncharacterized protein LOC141649223 [Silene latifolia]|uniref:uncharacterized protein LOC141649223 n=1 Tax=Silene latifolia TaxID=37657 RepID=UPI003D7716F6
MTGDSIEQQLAATKQQLLEMEQLMNIDFSNFGTPTPSKTIAGDLDSDSEETPNEEKHHEKFEKIPGIPTSIEEANPESYADSAFVDEIAKIDLPKKLVVQSMWTYDGTADPQNHVAYYKQRMLAASIPSELRQVCMCKGFGTTLNRPALQWYINLPNGSIKSFADMINLFNHQFASSMELEKRSSDMYRIKQKPGETIRPFLTRFNKEKVSIPRCDIRTAVEAFRERLPLDSNFFDELTVKPCLTFEDVQAKALGYIRMEEDKSVKAETTDSVSRYERSNRKSFNHRGSSSRPSPYTRLDRSEEYKFSFDTTGVIKRLDHMGDIVKWPKKTDNPNSRKDTTRCCEFHMDIEHTTEGSLGLRREVACLLKKG